MAPGWRADPPLLDLAVSSPALMFPYLVLVGLAALASGTLNAHHRFFTAALGPAVLNLAMIVAVLRPRSRHYQPPIVSLAVGRARGRARPAPRPAPRGAAARRAAAPVAANGAIRRCATSRGASGRPSSRSPRCRSRWSSTRCSPRCCPPGRVSYLYYADRVMEFPLGVFGIALATAALPSMSAQAAQREFTALRCHARVRAAALRLHRGARDGGTPAPGRAHRPGCSSSAASSPRATPR